MGNFRVVQEIDLDTLVVTRGQARTREVETNLDELVENLRIHGQLEPIVVAPMKSAAGERKYEIVAGQRRYLAARRLNWETIQATVFDEQLDEASTRALSISENLIRQDLTAKDLIDACTELYRKYGSVKAVSEELGLPYNKVRSYVKFERLRPALKELVGAGTIDIKTAIRVDDFCGDRDVEPAELKETAAQVAGMTNAQQLDYFRTLGRRNSGAPGNGKVGAPAGQAEYQPGAVAQMVVTLRQDDHVKLRRWATERGMGLDAAARGIIARFLRSVERAAQKESSGAA